MKRCVSLLLFLVCYPAQTFAANMYVAEVTEITMRTGKGIEHKIVAMLRSGQEVEVVEKGDDWSEVRLPNGKQGWVLSRFLTSNEPSRRVLERLRQQYEQVKEESESVLKENARLKKENALLAPQVAEQKERIEELERTLAEFKEASSDVFALKEKLEATQKALTVKTKEAEQARRLSQGQQWRQGLAWFGLGAAVLLVGMALGASFRRKRSYGASGLLR